VIDQRYHLFNLLFRRHSWLLVEISANIQLFFAVSMVCVLISDKLVVGLVIPVCTVMDFLNERSKFG